MSLEQAKVDGEGVKFSGTILLTHDDIVELSTYINTTYDMEAREGLRWEGEHNVIFDLKEETKSSNSYLVDFILNFDWDRARDMFYRLTLTLWFVMVILYLVGAR